ncbi:Oidioi.mRNA.OKI2018_I69.chr2.g6804.t1.cds [Oikopleura dioica]|uniref:Oidioi.mRNA.OKI2018_I69.chr2.g6804.t1.cds n=1 Tax=Oikopleura dioica TaxID=34765 RepID=A0ABN7TAB2_OIKDI|nr:Oidioi.mRNA.OKI2018_I69.chr2.g6804.t1.cds [Oikopleura dioica]
MKGQPKKEERPRNFQMTIWIKLMFYIGYLFFGSFIFMEIEQPAKEQRCQEIENELFVNMRNDLFSGNFYRFGYNAEVCEKGPSPKLMNIWTQMLENKCSQQIVDSLTATLQGQERGEYLTGWKKLLENLHKPVNRTLSIKGSNIIELSFETINYAIHFHDWSNICHIGNWTYGNAFVFMGSLASTIGYGQIVPHTRLGKTMCIVSSAFAIPLFASLI